jgi:hypothetical protein
MIRIEIEAFTSFPPDPNSAKLERLLKEIALEFENKVEIVVYPETSELFEERNLNASPALIIGELIKFIGFCPDKESMIIALKESGLD